MKTEADIASYLGTEGCIVYAQAFSTISSVIPAFCKRGDVIITDKAANYSIRKGLEISRSTIRWFNHGDMQDLENQMKKGGSGASQAEEADEKVHCHRRPLRDDGRLYRSPEACRCHCQEMRHRAMQC